MVGINNNNNNPRFQLSERISKLQDIRALPVEDGRDLLRALKNKELSRDAIHELLLGLENSFSGQSYRGTNLQFPEARERIKKALDIAPLNPWASQLIVTGGISALEKDQQSKESPGERFNRLNIEEGSNRVWNGLKRADREIFDNTSNYQQNFIDLDGGIILTTKADFTEEERQLYENLNFEPSLKFLTNKFKELKTNYKVNILVGKNPILSNGRPESYGLNTAFYDPESKTIKGYILIDPSETQDLLTIWNELSEVLMSARSVDLGGQASITARRSLQILSTATDYLAIDTTREKLSSQDKFKILTSTIQNYSKSKGYDNFPEFSTKEEALLAAKIFMEIKFPYAKLENSGITIEPKQLEDGTYTLELKFNPIQNSNEAITNNP